MRKDSFKKRIHFSKFIFKREEKDKKERIKFWGVVRDTTINRDDINIFWASNISRHCPLALLLDLSLREGNTLRTEKIKSLKFY